MPSVLYVDDEPELLTLCRLFLEKDGRNTVVTAESAVEGLRKLRAGRFDVIISDYLMPESDGVDFLKQVRAEFGDIPFIIFTGKGREEVIIEAINLGVTFYLQKGSDPASRFSELSRKIDVAVHRTKTEVAPQEKTGELDQFFTLALDLLCIADTDGYFRRLNPAWEMILGWRIDELEGKKFLDLVHPDDLPATVGAMEDLRAGKGIVNFVNRFRCKDGIYRWIEWRSFPYGEKLMYAAARDITERKQVEQALQLANRKLNLMAEITRHDIRNKLTVLGGYLSLLKEYPPKSQASMYVEKLMETTTIIAQHIEFTRLYQNLGVIPPSWQNVQAVFLRACTHADLQQVQLRSDLENIEIFADPLLERVFYNQIDNTMRYGGPKKTYISLGARETDEGLIVTIEDDGVGIPPQDKEKIFRRGFGKNTGLGLFLAREILSITGIGLRETGVYLQGARFELFIPKGSYRFGSPANHHGNIRTVT